MAINKTRFAKGLKSKTSLKIQRDSTDTLIYLNYLLFMQRLLAKAKEYADNDGSTEVMSRHLSDAKTLVLREFAG